MIPNPIRKVLSSIQTNNVRALLMGGQACVFYGGAEFSRDTDLAILATAENVARLQHALRDLRAEVIAVPPFELKYLRKGHAVHFRCHHPEAESIRVDIMTKMRGAQPFSKLWNRRTTVQLDDGTQCELMGLADLIRIKKTQREKDWTMIRRLVEAHYFANYLQANPNHVRFWLRELRTPTLLVQLAKANPETCQAQQRRRSLLKYALRSDSQHIEGELAKEQEAERAADRKYWLSLRAELERLRHERLSRA